MSAQQLAADVLLDVQELRVKFPVFGGILLRRVGDVEAVKGISFQLHRGETLGLVGESGCGKTTVGRAIINILRAMSYRVEISGRILYSHPSGIVDLAPLTRKEMRPYRADIQMVFQDPYSSLNPRKTVDQIVGEPLRIHTKMSRAERADRVTWLLEKVGLSARHVNRYPHEFSGGQRQRIGLARALAIIAHDLSVVRHISNRIAVMSWGNIVEIGPAEEIYRHPQHAYSKTLLAAAPRPDPAFNRARRK